ncbi:MULTISPECIES: hypothetical protein [unclassified Haloferax]|nr:MULTISPECIES: hypothetical protein [unclassified Haloferax]MDS0243950.1 hypothetical protein [Haloferax sp. S2CR25]MDS0447071.1 hypothetical protein [Haloferax sp. S2CR25-2]
MSDVGRELLGPSLAEYVLVEDHNDVPEEVRDLMDDDLIANAGGEDDGDD